MWCAGKAFACLWCPFRDICKQRITDKEQKMIELLKHIGNTMGFGDAMWCLSALWSIHLEENGLSAHGAFVPTIGFKDDDYETKNAELEKTRQEYMKKIKNFNSTYSE